MLRTLVIISVLVIKTYCVCQLKRQTLTCQNENCHTTGTNFYTARDSINQLELTNCSIQNLDQEIPFSNLRNLSIACEIEEIHPSAFINLNQLKTLVLSGNKIRNIPDAIFKNLSHLEYLDLSHNALTNTTSLCFKNLSKLKILKLDFNFITNVDAGFGHLPNLEELYLNGNGLSGLPSGAIEGNRKLKVLDVSDNDINHLNCNLLEPNNKLDKLVLENNPFENIPTNYFLFTPRLLHLNIGFTGIKNFNGNVFNPITHLQTLILRGNDFEIPEKISILKYLVSLDISYMHLEQLPENFLKYHTKIKHINVSGNKFKVCPPSFQKKHSIKSLNFSHNQLTEVPKSRYWLKLERMDVSYNRLETIEISCRSLKYINLRGNMIDHIGTKNFSSDTLDKLEVLDMRDNRLAFLEPNFFSKFRKLRTFEFVGNPWECKCLEHLMQRLGERDIGYAKDNYFQGMTRICIAINVFECNVDVKDLKRYYEEFYN